MLAVDTERIKRLRIELGMTQQELATKAGLRSKGTICKREKQPENWTINSVNKIARALGINPILLIKQV